MTTTAPVETPAEVITTLEDVEPPYAVIIHNDEVNSMAHVVQSLMHCIPDLSHEEAAEVMLEAHQNGKARATIAPHDKAAEYRNCLESRGLTATIEPVY